MGAAVSLSGEQAGNARLIVAAAKALGLPQQATAVAIMTGRQESALLVLAKGSELFKAFVMPRGSSRAGRCSSTRCGICRA